MKGIILAGGTGSRLHPVTIAVSKQLLPIYNKPMIYYPLSVLLLSGIKEILIITNRENVEFFQLLFGNGKQLGIKIEYAVQEKANGIAEAFIIGEKFIGNDSVCLILGDNIFYGDDLIKKLKNAIEIVEKEKKACIFCYNVKDPERYGVATYNTTGEVTSIEEKPTNPQSNYAVTGLYFYPNNVIELSKSITPSDRGELEITSINQLYLKSKELKVQTLGRGFAWLDTGTYESLLEASLFIQTIEKRQGLMIACIEEIVYDLKYINKEEFIKLIDRVSKNEYGQYLKNKLNS
ncbi:MAG: glucose-1-phosphate thymidylyltransferase RfbA [Flavobacteriia bacterium]|nr:glucose-1-phosphate thymidylyltransferase RfbA [Flavobacteriia bacterium]